MGQWEDDPNAEGGTRNAEQQGEVERRGALPRATPVMMFRVPTSAFRVLMALWRPDVSRGAVVPPLFVAREVRPLLRRGHGGRPPAVALSLHARPRGAERRVCSPRPRA